MCKESCAKLWKSPKWGKSHQQQKNPHSYLDDGGLDFRFSPHSNAWYIVLIFDDISERIGTPSTDIMVDVWLRYSQCGAMTSELSTF